MPLDLGSLEVYMGPTELGAPDDLEATIISFIDGAQDSLDVAVQELESQPITQALITARQRGVRVRIVLEADYLGVRTAVPNPWAPGGQNEHNREMLAALLRANVEVHSDLNPEIFHQKFIVRDPGTSRVAVLTGSTNFTPTGTHANLNHIVILRSERIADLYGDEFEECWTGTFGQLNERHGDAPRTYQLAGVRIKTLFAPDHCPELEIMKQMLKAQSRVDFAMFTFAQSSGIDDAMGALNWAQIPVRGVLDRMQANQTWAATRPMHNAGAELWRIRTGTNVNKLHHKLAVIDRQATIVGSFNYTGPANAMNDENILVIGDLESTDAQERQRQGQIADYALAEIDRIIDTFGELIP